MPKKGEGKGYYYNKSANKYVVYERVNGRNRQVKWFDLEEDAAAFSKEYRQKNDFLGLSKQSVANISAGVGSKYQTATRAKRRYHFSGK